MSGHDTSQRGVRLLTITAASVVILWGIYQAQSMLVIFLVAGFLASIGRVPVRWMEQRRIPSVLAVSIVLSAMVVLLLSLGVVVGMSLNKFSDTVPSYQARAQEMLLALKPLLETKGIVISDEVLLTYVNPGAVMSLTADVFTALSSGVSNILLILFIVVFILLEASSFPAKLRSVLGNPQAAFPELTKFFNDIKRYMVIKTLISLLAGTLAAIWLTILGVDFPILWGVLAFLLHFIPNVGFVLAALPPVLFALVQYGGTSAVLSAAGYLVIGMVFGNIVEPKIMGLRLGLSPLVVFVSVIVWGNLLGLVGALLCVPLTMIVRLGCDASDATRWIAVLLGPGISLDRIPIMPRHANVKVRRRGKAHSDIDGS